MINMGLNKKMKNNFYPTIVKYVRCCIIWIGVFLVIFFVGCANTKEKSNQTMVAAEIKEWHIIFRVSLWLLRTENDSMKIVYKTTNDEYPYVKRINDFDTEAGSVEKGKGRCFRRFSLSFGKVDSISETSLSFSLSGKLNEKDFKEYFNNIKWGEGATLIKPIIMDGELWMLVGSIQPVLKTDTSHGVTYLGNCQE